MTYPLQFAAGALMNTAGSGNDFVGGTNGYGNVQFNGLPSLSNGYIVDGLETNDPLTNLNSGLSTNLVLGLNSIAEVTVNTLSYTVDQGRYGASQVNYVTKSGTNQFHGNLYELWNGSRFNAADFFTNATPGQSQAALHREPFRRQPGRADPARQAVLLLRQRMGADRPAHRVRHHRSDRRFPAIRPAAACRWAARTPSPARLTSRRRNWFPSIRRCSACIGTRRERRWRFWAVRSTATEARPPALLPTETVAPIARASRIRATITSRCRPLASITTSTTRTPPGTGFRSDTGLQAAYTDPINPLFNALSPQPLYSFAAGYTHVFSSKLVNYFNPAFSWYESLFGPADFQKTLAAFPIVLQGSGANAPFTTIGGLDNTWVQGRRASRFFINDNLAWTTGAHELRFGTNTRIFRLNDYDFGEGAVPLVTYTTLPQFIYGVASTASKTFPLADSQPYNFLNLDLYAQDTWKVTPELTWTFGMRATHNSESAESARCRGAARRLLRLDLSRCESAAERGHPDRPRQHLSQSTPLAILQPRTAIAWQIAPKTVLRTGFGLFSDLLPGSDCRSGGRESAVLQTFQGGLLGTVGGTAIAPGVPGSAIDATVAAESEHSARVSPAGTTLLRFAARRIRPRVCQPVAITAVPDGKLRAPYFMEWSFALEQQIGNSVNLRAQYVGTRAVNQPYTTQVNGYQTVCQGCFAPFPYGAPTDPRFGAVTQLSTGANSHYNGLQTTAEKRLGHGLQVQVNYTWSHCIDTVSNGGFLPFSAGGILSPIPGDLERDRGPCDYDVRHNVTASYVYQLPIKLRGRLGACAQRLAGFRARSSGAADCRSRF